MITVLNLWWVPVSGKTKVAETMVNLVKEYCPDLTIHVMDDYKFIDIDTLKKDIKERNSIDYLILITERRINSDIVESATPEEAIKAIMAGIWFAIRNYPEKI